MRIVALTVYGGDARRSYRDVDPIDRARTTRHRSTPDRLRGPAFMRTCPAAVMDTAAGHVVNRVRPRLSGRGREDYEASLYEGSEAFRCSSV